MQKCKITSIKPLGKQKTYNLTMAGDQHNYKIVDTKGNGIYSQNSHSAAYAYIAYQCAYLKIKYPLEFMCNLLSSEINNSDKGEKLNQYLNAAKNMNVICKPPNINISGCEFKIGVGYHKDLKKNVECLWKPLTILKGVGEKTVRGVIANQPFSSLEEFMSKMSIQNDNSEGRTINASGFKTLLEAGCMDEAWKLSKDDYDRVLKEYEAIKKRIDKDKKDKKKQIEKASKMGRSTLFNDDEDNDDEYSVEKLHV